MDNYGKLLFTYEQLIFLMNDNWDDYRSAFEVAKAGSLSQAAKHLALSHSTLIRHIDRLEAHLNTKLFIRHQRGYQLTEAGHILLQELPNIQHQFSRLQERIQNTTEELSGEIVITTVPSYATRMHKAFKALMDAYPNVRLTMLATDEVISLAAGTVHVAIRPGNRPNSNDIITKPLASAQLKLYASNNYRKLHGLPESIDDVNQHYWIMPTGFKRSIPVFKPLLEAIPLNNITYQSNHFSDMAGAISADIGIGIATTNIAKDKGLIATPFQIEGHSEQSWFIYHKDLRNNSKVSVLYDFLQQYL
ncbi:LysR family transcriptional regulator [Shewanella sp. 202IG2-18]|uniref:LysR family transcriptional regulator n=1 Tax=Parashewanella hymeniacidonis TaxID=2807618 RepID=UPI001961BF54|nr:LysR family transcriptional regulator [Parashewanella hymeniacidonis]MBM7072560.1 LysR family transcriptional regulator [Parashewanella hymeniacidonis]